VLASRAFISLGKLLAANGWNICVTGAPVEQEVAATIASRIGTKAVCAAGETSFRQSIALLSCGRACVTGDTAQMHASCALGIPTYAIFGPTNPVETGPYGDGHYVFSGHGPHMPCFKSECTSQECMKSIAPKLSSDACKPAGARICHCATCTVPPAKPTAILRFPHATRECTATFARKTFAW